MLLRKNIWTTAVLAASCVLLSCAPVNASDTKSCGYEAVGTDLENGGGGNTKKQLSRVSSFRRALGNPWIQVPVAAVLSFGIGYGIRCLQEYYALTPGAGGSCLDTENCAPDELFRLYNTAYEQLRNWVGDQRILIVEEVENVQNQTNIQFTLYDITHNETVPLVAHQKMFLNIPPIVPDNYHNAHYASQWNHVLWDRFWAHLNSTDFPREIPFCQYLSEQVSDVCMKAKAPSGWLAQNITQMNNTWKEFLEKGTYAKLFNTSSNGEDVFSHFYGTMGDSDIHLERKRGISSFFQKVGSLLFKGGKKLKPLGFVIGKGALEGGTTGSTYFLMDHLIPPGAAGSSPNSGGNLTPEMQNYLLYLGYQKMLEMKSLSTSKP